MRHLRFQIVSLALINRTLITNKHNASYIRFMEKFKNVIGVQLQKRSVSSTVLFNLILGINCEAILLKKKIEFTNVWKHFTTLINILMFIIFIKSQIVFFYFYLFIKNVNISFCLSWAKLVLKPLMYHS